MSRSPRFLSTKAPFLSNSQRAIYLERFKTFFCLLQDLSRANLFCSLVEDHRFKCQRHWYVGNCDIHFFNFRHCQVKNFQILNQSKWDWNFTAKFWNHQKRKLTKCNNSEWNQRITLWNFVRCRKIFVKFHPVLLNT